MDAVTITALTGAATAALGGIGTLVSWHFKRVDHRRERAEDQMLKHLEAQLARVEKDMDALRAQHRADQAYADRVRRAAGLWREQLIANGISPVPADWPEKEGSRL